MRRKAIKISFGAHGKRLIQKAAMLYVQELIKRKEAVDRYTKFDSDNDIFLGELGEQAFAKFLHSKGFLKGIDYRRSADSLHNGNATLVNDVFYDAYDFELNLFFGENGEARRALRIDVKTQKYVGNWDKYWQFAVNAKTVNKIKGRRSVIDSFVFVFSKDGIGDFIDYEALKEMDLESLKNIKEVKLKKNDIVLEIAGSISSQDFVKRSTFFSKGEVFRINKTKNGVKAFKVFSDMYRINIGDTYHPNKVFPSRNVSRVNVESLEEYKKLVGERNKFVKIISDGQELLFPYGKVFENSPFMTFEEALKKMVK